MRLVPLALALATLSTLSACTFSDGGDQSLAPSPMTPNTSPAPLPVASAPEWQPPAITPQELNAKIAAGEALVVVDVRPLTSFEAERIQNAISLPWGDLDKRHQELPKDKLIVLYCA